MKKPDMRKSEASLKSAFHHEVRPDVYLGRVSTTILLAVIVLGAVYCFHDGQFDTKFVIPPAGEFKPRDPAGGLYADTWMAIFADAVQASFGLWGGILVLIGIYKILFARRFVLTAFTLGGAFLGMTYFVPYWTPTLLKWLLEKYPVLAG